MLRWIWSNGIVHHKSDRKLCVIPTADRNNALAPLVIEKDHGQLLIESALHSLEIARAWEVFSGISGFHE